MSGSTDRSDQAGPALSGAIEVVQGSFPSDATLQDAIGRLTVAGFDRADISLPDAQPTSGQNTPEQGAENPNAEDDTRQARTLHTSMAASVGALAAAGAVIATGGAAIPAVAAAVAGGAGLGAVMEGITGVGDRVQHEERQEAASRGELLLSVHLRDTTQQAAAQQAMQAAGATEVRVVRHIPDSAATPNTSQA